MRQRRVLDSISKILVRCMLLIVNFNICDSFLGSSFGRSQAPITSASGILGKSVASGDSGDGRYMHPPLSLHASSRGEGSLDSPRLTRIIYPPVLSVPVFSLATVNGDGSTNMNVVTYASPVGIEPERLWMVSLYKTTVSHENFFREGWGVLQHLQRRHASLVPILGKASSRDTVKSGRCARQGFPWERHAKEVVSAPRSVAILPGCTAYLTLRLVSDQPAGDHDAAICRVVGMAGLERGQEISMCPETETLETRHLREAGLIS